MIKILLTGGGTGGSVSPLLAVASQLRIRNKELGIMKKIKNLVQVHLPQIIRYALCVMRYAITISSGLGHAMALKGKWWRWKILNLKQFLAENCADIFH